MKRFHVLTKLIRENNFTSLVEVGVADGRTSKFILDNIKDPGFKIYCVDPYEVYEGYEGSHHGSPQDLQDAYEYANKNVFSKDRCKFYKLCSGEAVKFFDAGSIDLVFIDGNHYYEWVKEDIEYWYPIVREGGILSGHDYVKKYGWGVKRAVDEFVEKYGLELLKAKDNVWYINK